MTTKTEETRSEPRVDLTPKGKEQAMHGSINSARTGRAGWAVALLAVVAMGACDFEATDPTSIGEEDIQTDAAMTALMVGAVKSYDDAYERLVMFTGVISDEMVASGSWDPWHQADKNGIILIDAPESDHINIPWRLWREMQRARVAAEETFEWMGEVLENPSADPRAAMVRLYSGLAYADFGEVFCEAAYDNGHAVAPAESFEIALSRLDEAAQIAQTAGVDSIVHMAHLVRARIHIEQGDLDAAMSEASAVPDGLLWEANFRDATGERSYFWGNNAERGESSVHPDLRDLDDPRVPSQDMGRLGPDTFTEVWAQLKYPTRNDNFIVGSWREARLIQAEVLLEQGDSEGALELVNEVRADWDLDPLATDQPEAEALETFQEERKFSLWLEGRRMGDMRRWGLFPDGWQAECLPISREERNSNPNL
jgi:hypothetical protein